MLIPVESRTDKQSAMRQLHLDHYSISTSGENYHDLINDSYLIFILNEEEKAINKSP